MTEARIYFSIVTAMKATGYPECEALTAHPLAWFSKRCDGRAEVRRADERSESGSNALLGGALFTSALFPSRTPTLSRPAVAGRPSYRSIPPGTRTRPDLRTGELSGAEQTPVSAADDRGHTVVRAEGDERGPMKAAHAHRMRFLLYAAGHLRGTTSTSNAARRGTGRTASPPCEPS
jgi:hypothetical protein